MSETQRDWHAVGGMSDLPAGSARAVTLLDTDIAVWRGESGAVQAWENRCPHRGMRLSFGQVRGDRLSCRYHGWQYDPAGQCTFMPAHRKMTPPATVCVPSYGCREAGGLVWVNLSDAEAPFDEAAGGFETGTLFCKSLFVDGTPDALADLLIGAVVPPLAAGAEAGGSLTCEVLDHGRGSGESHAVVAWTRASGEDRETVSTSYHGKCVAPGLLHVVARTGDAPPESLAIALQAMTETRVGLHLVAEATGDDETDRLKRRHIGRWARRLRWFLENPEAPSDGFRPWV